MPHIGPETGAQSAVGTIVAEHYELLEFVGAGGMGEVYRARQLDLDTIVAVKILRARGTASSDALKRMQREAKILGTLKHPSIPKVLRIENMADGSIFLAMDWLPGSSLDAVLRERGRLPFEEARKIFLQISEALMHAHAKGVVHRDLKPANIMITEERAYVLDFGIAKIEEQKLTGTGVVLGTVQYMSPEQAEGKQVDARSDVYSLACVLYEALSGKPLFTADSALEMLMHHMQTTLPPMTSPDFGGLGPMLEHSLAKEAAQRFQSMEEFHQALLTPGDIKPRAANRKRTKRKPNGKLLACSTAVAVVACAALAYTTLTPPTETAPDLMSSEQAYTTIEHAAQTGNLTPNVEAAIDLVLQDKITLPPAKAAKALARIGIAYGVNGRTELADRIIALSVRQCKKCGETDLEGPAAQLQWHTKEEGLALLTEHMQAYRSGTARERAVPWGLHNLRATLHRQMGQPDEALEDYETMTMANLRSKFREASLGWIGQTEVYLEKKDLAKAKQCLQEWRKIATDERPDRLLFEPSILELTGRVQEAEGRHLEALKSYHGCIDAASMLHMGKPRNHPQKSFVHHAVSAAHTGAGRMQELRGDYDSALKHYIAAIKAAKPTGDSELLRIRQKEHDDAIARLGPGTPTAK